MEKQIQETTQKWKEVVDAYQRLLDSIVEFQATAPDTGIDHFGPEVNHVYQLRSHIQRPTFVVDMLQEQGHRHGSLVHLTPKQPIEDSEKEKGKSTTVADTMRKPARSGRAA